MEQVRVRNNHQITIPARIAKSADLKPGDILKITCTSGIITLLPVSAKTKNKSIMSYAGIAKGIWITPEVNDDVARNQ